MSVQSCVLSANQEQLLAVTNMSNGPLELPQDCVITTATECDKPTLQECEKLSSVECGSDKSSSVLDASPLPLSTTPTDVPSPFHRKTEPPPDDVAPVWPDGPPDIAILDTFVVEQPDCPTLDCATTPTTTKDWVSPFLGWPTIPPDILPTTWPDEPPDKQGLLSPSILRIKSDIDADKGLQSSTLDEVPPHLCNLFESCTNLNHAQRPVGRGRTGLYRAVDLL